MRLLPAVLFVVLLAFPASAQTTTYRDWAGREVGTSATVGNTTVYRDRMGRQTGSSIRSGDRTTVYDRMGREIGRAVPTPNLK